MSDPMTGPMTGKVRLELVAPERLLIDEAVEMVVVPGTEGDFGVLAGHAPMISSVRPGVIEIHEGDSVKDRIFVAGGFAEVTGDRCTILAEEATRLPDLDRAKIEAELKALGSDLADAGAGAARDRLVARIAIAQAKLAALDA